MTNTLQQAEALLSGMTWAEKAELLHWAVSDLSGAFPSVESAPDVCGGEPRIAGTRIPVWALKQARRLGMDDASLLRAYPTLRASDLTQAWAYVRVRRSEIEQQIWENEEA